MTFFGAIKNTGIQWYEFMHAIIFYKTNILVKPFLILIALLYSLVAVLPIFYYTYMYIGVDRKHIKK